MPDVVLTVNGTEYGGWKSMRLTRGIEQIAGTFELGVSELWPGEKIMREIAPGDTCTVIVDGATVITGYVDDVIPDYGDRDHEVSVSGRDATGDLVDCSAIHKSGKWAAARMEIIAADLCSPFGIKVTAEVDTGAAAEWNIQEGESAHECLDRLARSKGVLLVSDGKGGLLITRAGKGGAAGVSLKRGENILRARLEFSFRERFSQYTVKGQGASNDVLFASATRQKATTTDPMIARYRPLIVIADDLIDGAGLKRRALWEANTRAGKSAQIAVKVQGWSYPSGTWKPNQLVHLNDPWVRTDADMLIKQVTFTLDDTGTLTELALVLPQAFDLIPLPKRKPTDAWEMLGKQQKEIDRLKRDQERQR